MHPSVRLFRPPPVRADIGFLVRPIMISILLLVFLSAPSPLLALPDCIEFAFAVVLRTVVFVGFELFLLTSRVSWSNWIDSLPTVSKHCIVEDTDPPFGFLRYGHIPTPPPSVQFISIDIAPGVSHSYGDWTSVFPSPPFFEDSADDPPS